MTWTILAINDQNIPLPSYNSLYIPYHSPPPSLPLPPAPFHRRLILLKILLCKPPPPIFFYNLFSSNPYPPSSLRPIPSLAVATTIFAFSNICLKNTFYSIFNTYSLLKLSCLEYNTTELHTKDETVKTT